MSGRPASGKQGAGVQSRALAAELVRRILSDRAYSQRVLHKALDEHPLAADDRAFVTHLTYGTLTWLRVLDEAIEAAAARPVSALDEDLLATLRVGAFQLLILHDTIPAFAVVNAAVEGVRARRGRGAAGFVNALLRRLSREAAVWRPSPLPPQSVAEIAARGSLPDWIAAELVLAVGHEGAWRELCAMNAPTPVTLRMSAADHTTREQKAALGLAPHPWLRDAWVSTPGQSAWREQVLAGAFVVQDAGAQVVGEIARGLAPDRVLDACAGVGTKTSHLASLLPEATLVATDRHPRKLDVLSRTLRGVTRAQPVETAVWEAGLQPPPPKLSPAFDLVIVDAPCSALGTLGRHPEVRWHRRPEDVAALVAVQARLLDACALLVRPGGHLLYTVCTFTRTEGPEQIERFLKERPAWRGVSLGSSLPAALQEPSGGLLLPSRDASDAFYLGLAQRVA